MTVSYSRLVANGSSFGCFWSILRKWKGSVYKLVWRELIVYMLLYFAINMAYRFALTEPQQKIFLQIRMYFKGKSQSIPMSFVLGFYVTLVVKRWWEQYRLLPWPDTLALFVSAAIPGADERGRLMRRTIVRYAVLAYIITLKHVSVRIKKRFPTLQHIVDAGFLMESEKKIFEMLETKTPMTKYWLPLTWATNIINRARKELRIHNDHMVQTILLEMSDMRGRLGSLIGYDNVNIPIVYTQIVDAVVHSLSTLFPLINMAYCSLAMFAIHCDCALDMESRTGRKIIHVLDAKCLVNFGGCFRLTGPPIYILTSVIVSTLVVTLSVYTYFLAALIGAQMIPTPPTGPTKADDVDLYFPVITVLEAAYMIVDEMHEEHPELLKDQYWDEVVPKDLPYTVGSEHYRKEEPKGSAEFYKVKQSDALYANISNNRRKSVMPDDMYADYESVDTPVVERRNNKSWLTRTINRVGSIRSSSTTYSSGGIFRQARRNSTYSSPETGTLPAGNISLSSVNPSKETNGNHKMSFYDRLAGRKSGRSAKLRPATTKMNGSVPSNVKNRPRIPTPDVTKEPFDVNSQNNNINQGNLSPTSSYPGELPVVQVLLSPIQEMETLQTNGSPMPLTTSHATSALAQAVLSPALKSVGFNNVSTVSMPMNAVTLTAPSLSRQLLSTLSMTSSSATTPIILAEGAQIPAPDKDELSGGTGSDVSTSSSDEKIRKISATQKRGEVYV